MKLAPSSSDAHYDLGLALLQSGSPQRALGELRAAARLKPGTPRIHLALGMALSDAKQLDAAIDEFRTVLKTEPASVPASAADVWRIVARPAQRGLLRSARRVSSAT